MENFDEDLCDMSWSFTYMPHEDDEPTEFFGTPAEVNLEKQIHKFSLDDGISLNIQKDMLKEILKTGKAKFLSDSPDPEKPTCSSVKDSPISVELTDGVHIELSSSKYNEIFEMIDDKDLEDTTSNILSDSPIQINLSDGISIQLSQTRYTDIFGLSNNSQPMDAKSGSVIIDTDSDESQKPDDSGDESDSKVESSNKKTEKKKEENKTKSKKDVAKSKGGKEQDAPKSDEEENTENDKKTKRAKKRKSKKDSDVSNTESSESMKKSKPKKKKKKTETEKKSDKKKESDEDDSDDDEEIKRINQAAAKIPTYKSIKNLVKQKYYKVLDLSEVETSKGKTIRLRLEDADVEDGWCYIHMPRNVLIDMFPLTEKLKAMCQSEKGLFFKFAGMKGLAFKIKFSRNPK